MTEAPQKVTVSHSEVESYLKCERAHFYGYGLEITRQPAYVSDSLYRGTKGHAGLQYFFELLREGYGLPEAQSKAAAFVAMEAIERPEVAKELVRCFQAFYKNYPYHGWTILEFEREYVLPVTEELAMPFIPDLIARDMYGDIWLIDNKFVYDFYTARDTELMSQLPKYLMGLRALGIEVDKLGYSMYRYRSQTSQEADKYYKFTPVEFTPERVMQTMTEQVVVSDRIQRIKATLSLEDWSGQAMRTANSMVCTSCGFRSLCVAELNNWQPNLVLNAEYEKKTRREFQVTTNG
jgi:hypothetical protein